MRDIRKQAYDYQVTQMIDAFVQLWIRFESMLHRELARRHNLDESDNAAAGNDGNYGMYYRISSIIHAHKQMTMGELSIALSVPFSKATRLVSWMVDEGYARRLADETDRRVVRVALTDKGMELHREIGNYVRERVGELLTSSLTSEENMILFTLINKVVPALENVANKNSD